MCASAGLRFWRDALGDPGIRDLDQLIAAWLAWFRYDPKNEGSPYPSGEPPPDAIRRWYTEHMALDIVGANTYAWACTGCGASLSLTTNYLHTLEPYDFAFWEFCPTCGPAIAGKV